MGLVEGLQLRQNQDRPMLSGPEGLLEQSPSGSYRSQKGNRLPITVIAMGPERTSLGKRERETVGCVNLLVQLGKAEQGQQI